MQDPFSDKQNKREKQKYGFILFKTATHCFYNNKAFTSDENIFELHIVQILNFDVYWYFCFP